MDAGRASGRLADSTAELQQGPKQLVAVTVGSGARAPQGAAATRRRAVALMLVTIAVIVAGTVGYSYLGAQTTSVAIAQNIDDASHARYVAETGMDIALSYIKNTSNWRSAEPNGTWASSISFGGGAYTIRGEDGIDANGDGTITTPTEGDGSLADNASDPATLTVTATAGAASYKVSSVISGGSGSGGEDYGFKWVWGLHSDDVNGMQIASRISITDSGTLTSLSYYGDGPTSRRFRLALYTNSNGRPNALVAQTAATTPGSAGTSWRTAPVTNPVNVDPGTYWIVTCVEDQTMDLYYTIFTGEVEAKAGDAVGPGYSASWGSSFFSFPAALNVYATLGSTGMSVDWKN